MSNKPKCEACESENLSKVIYYGMPHNYCNDCETIMGNFITWRLPFSDNAMSYECGYLKALWYWLFYNWRSDD